jgi:uncharacterized paraquat-inducible protein A
MNDELVTCPACREKISKQATKCSKCQTVLVAAPAPSMAGALIGGIVVTALLFLFWQWFSPILMGI